MDVTDQPVTGSMPVIVDLLNGTNANANATKSGIDLEKMGKMMSFTFGAVCFVLLLLLLDLYDRRCSAYVKAKLCRRKPKDSKKGNSSADVEAIDAPLNDCKPSTSTSAC